MTIPFTRVLVPFDGSEPSARALEYGIAFAKGGAALDVINIVDDTAAVTQTETSLTASDPEPLIEALDTQGRALLDDAQARARAAGVEAALRLIHETAIPGIVGAAEKNGDQLIIMGTHARGMISSALLGSTTAGVLRSGSVPMLTVHAEMPSPPADGLFRKVLVAVDDSEPADAAAAVAARLSHTLRTKCVLCCVFDPDDVIDRAATVGYDPTQLVDEQRTHAQLVVDRARARGGFADGAASVSVVEDEPAAGIVAEAARIGADAIVVGSHGRRGLRRLFLGSIAEHVVRLAPIPVLVVRTSS